MIRFLQVRSKIGKGDTILHFAVNANLQNQAFVELLRACQPDMNSTHDSEAGQRFLKHMNQTILVIDNILLICYMLERGFNLEY